MSIRSQLYPVHQPLANIVHKGESVAGVALPTAQERISLLSASKAVQVQISPAPSGAAFAVGTLRLGVNDSKCRRTARAGSSHCGRCDHGTRRMATGILQQLSNVLKRDIDNALIDRIDDPSQSIERIWARLARGSLFIANIIRDQSRIVNA